MAGIPFLSKILALAGIGVKNQTDNKEVLINVSPSQPSSSTVSIDLPPISGTLAVKSEVVLASEKGAVDGVATLDGSGKVPTTQLPPYSISDVFVVADQAARLALVAQVGDVAVQTDTNTTYILQSEPASVNANWIVISATNAVTAVNGHYGPGPVVVSAADVGAVALTGDTMSGVLTMGPVSTGAGEAGQIAFKELAANGSYSVTLRSPDALADYVVLTLPANHGSSGQILTSNGSGVMSWQNAPADSVTSVNGKVGVVVLSAADVGAVALAGDTMTGALVIGPIGALSGETGVIRLKELASNGTSSISIRAADEMSADVALTLPSSAGSSGQVLSTNGSGVLSWLSLPADSVTSVNGQTGIVVLYTDNISENIGATNLWFTDARAKSAAVVNSTAGSQTDQAPSVSAVKAYVAASSPVLSVAGKTGVVTLNTSDVSEGTNLYFTDFRAQTAAVVNTTAGAETDQAPSVFAVKAYVAASSPVLSVAGKTGVVTLSTTDVSEGTNLYFTDGRAQSAAVVNSTAGSQTDQAPSVSAMKAYVAPISSGLAALEAYKDAQLVMVSKSGNDSTGTGGQHKPYLTVGAALASITDASPTKRYLIKVQPGAYTEGALALKANVFICGDQKEDVRISATSFSLAADFSGSADNRSGMSKLIIAAGNATFDWSAVTSAAGKLYFSEVSTNGSITLTGHNNAIAQAQFDSCILFGALNISGINVGVFNNNICYGNITMTQHPNGGMASILAATGGQCNGTVTLNATTSDFSRRCSLFAKNFYCENLTINGPSAYADVNEGSMPRARANVVISNGGNYVPITARSPVVNQSESIGEVGYQYFYNFSYVHASTNSDLYLISMGASYAAASVGRSIFVEADSYGLDSNVNGGDINLTTAAVSGTGVRGKIKLDGLSVDVSSSKIINLANGVNANDAVNKSQLDALSVVVSGKVSKSGDTMTGALVIGPIGALSGETGVIRLGELAANGLDTISLRAPDALSSSITLTLPSNAGSSGQYLTTNGSGVLSWTTGTDSALSARVDKLEASRGVYTGSLNSGTVLNISSLVPSGAVEYPIVQIYKDEAGVSLQVNVEFSFNPTTKQITFGDVADGPINAVIHVLALTAPLTTL